MIWQVLVGLGISYLILYLLSLILKDNSIADIFWGLAFLQIAVHLSLISGVLALSQLVMLALIVLWSLRISSYILSKKKFKKGEDPRYSKWRKEWKFFYLRSFFQVYILQGFLASVIAIPIFLVNLYPSSSLGWLSIIGTVIAIFGLTYETIGDLQLSRFIRKKKSKENRIMKEGLWKYSRHPNYFGESAFWLGISIFASYVSVFSFLSWIFITVLLRYVSGVPMAEERYEDDKEYQEYKKKTPPMLPCFLSPCFFSPCFFSKR